MISISRRKLIHTGSILFGITLFSPLHGSFAKLATSTNSDAELFYHLSLFITARTILSRNVSLRALVMLTQQDKDFPKKMRLLWQMIQIAGLKHVDQLSDSHLIKDLTFSDVTQKIVSTWYLGYTGTPIALRAVDDTRFVTFSHALMFEATRDATLIPTYSRGQTNYWVLPPATLKND